MWPNFFFTESWDDLWDCSSNDPDGEETDSDTCEPATIAQKVQRQTYINTVVECFAKNFGGKCKKSMSTANLVVSLPQTEEGSLTNSNFFFAI